MNEDKKTSEDKKMGKGEYFELREKRLKLVYKILYVIVAIWIALVISIGNAGLTKETTPIYAFLLSVSSLCIIKILKYALMEFRCMKVVGELSQEVLVETETRYENIWKSFSVVLAFNAILMLLHIQFPAIFTQTTFLVVMWICLAYFALLSVSAIFITKAKDSIMRFFDVISILLSIAISYGICAFVCGVMANA